MFLTASPALAQTDAFWNTAVSGDWDNAALWSTNPEYPNNGSPNPGDTYNAIIDAAGSAYTVTGNVPVTLDNFTINAVDATFAMNADLTVNGVFDVQNGMVQATTLQLTAASLNIGASADFRVRSMSLRDTEVTGTVKVVDWGTDDGLLYWAGSSTLNNGVISLAGQVERSVLQIVSPHADGTSIAGIGEVVMNNTGDLATSYYPGGINHIYGLTNSGDHFVIESGITIRTGLGSGTLHSTRIRNEGVIAANTAGQWLDVEPSFFLENNGSLVADNGGALTVYQFKGDTGNLTVGDDSSITLVSDFDGFTYNQAASLGTNASLLFIGDFVIDTAIDFQTGGTLGLAGDWTSTFAINVENSSLHIYGGQFTSSLVTVSNSQVTIGQYNTGPPAITTAMLEDINHGNNTLTLDGRFDNTGDVFDLTDWNGDVTMAESSSIFGGQVISSDGSKLVGSEGGDFHDVDIQADVDITDGTITLSGQSSLSGDLYSRSGLVNLRNTFVNNGLVDAFNSDVQIGSNGEVWTNNGTIVVNGGDLTINGATANFGDITVNFGDYYLAGALTTADWESAIGNHVSMILGTSSKTGILENAGDVLLLNPVTGSLTIEYGFIRGGAISLRDGSTINVNPGGIFRLEDGVLLSGEINHINTNNFSISGGLQLLVGAIGLYDNDAEYNINNVMSFTGSDQAVTGVGIIRFDGPGDAHEIVTRGSILTIGDGIEIETTGGGGSLRAEAVSSDGENGGYINQGLIRATGAGRSIAFANLSLLENTGTLEAVNGGHLQIDSPDDWSNDGVIHLDNGSVAITGNTFTNNAGGQIEGVGTFDVSGTTFINNGTVSPGLSPGGLQIVGNWTQGADASMLIEVGQSTHDQLMIDGDMTLGGELQVVIIGNPTPQVGATFTIITADQVFGQFADLLLSVFNGIYSFDVQYAADAVTLEVFAYLLTGDANNDGVVDAADILAVEENLGSLGTDDGTLLGDANDDGRVDGLDWLAVEQHFGDVLSIPSPTVPEPATLTILAACLLACRERRR